MKKHKKTLPMDPIETNRNRIWFYNVQSRFKVNMMEIFVPWNESNFVRLLSQIFSGRESVIKLFDFRILSTLLIRDIRIFILKGQAIKAVMIITLPLLLYYLNSRSLIKRDKSSYNLMKIFPSVQHFGSRKKNLLLVPHLFMSLPKGKRRYQRRLLNPKEHVWVLSSSNTNLNQKNDRISENQGTISWESPSEKESNDIEWQVDSPFNSIQNEYWEPEKEPENLYEWMGSVINKIEIIERLENKIEQLEKKLVQTEEFDLPEEFLIAKRKERVEEIQKCKEQLKGIKKIREKWNKILEEIEQEEIEQEEIEQEESDRIRESYSFLESEFFKGLFDHLSIDESCISISSTKKPSEKLKLLKRRQDAFQYFRVLEKNRIVDLWKVKTYLKNPSVNYAILSDPGWNIRKDINQLNCIRFVNQSLSSRSSSSCDKNRDDQNKEQLRLNKEQLRLNKEQLRLNDYFQLKIIVFKITDQFTLLITKPDQNHSYNEFEFVPDVDYCIYQLCELNKNILLNKIFNYRDKLKHHSFSMLLNILDKENPYINKKIVKRHETWIQLILNDYKILVDEHFEKAFKNFHLLKNVLMKYSLSKVFNEYSKYYFKSDPALDDLEYETTLDDLDDLEYETALDNLESETALDKYAFSKSFQKYYFEWKKVFKRFCIKFIKTLNKYYFEWKKVFKRFCIKFIKTLNKYYFEWKKVFKRFCIEFIKTLNKYYFEWKKVFKRFCIEFIKTLNKYYFQLTKAFHKYYLEFLVLDVELRKILDLESHLELQKVLKKFYLIKRFLISRNLKDPIGTWIELNNVTQDAINRHSSSWRKCQKNWLNILILKNSPDNWTFEVPIQIEYLKKRLKHLRIRKKNKLKKRVFNPIELSTTQHSGWLGNPNKIFENKIYNIILDEINGNEIKSKSIPNLSQRLKSLINEKTIAPLGLNEKPISQLIIDLFDNGKNYMELFNNAGLSAIFNDRDNWLNPLKLSNQNSLRASFCKANTFEFLDYLHHPRLNYKKRLAPYMERIHIKNKNVTYGQLFNLAPIHNNLFSLSIGEIRAVYSEKETISLIKSQVNILLDKYLRDQALIQELHKSSNLLNQLNSFIHGKIDILSVEDIYKTPLIIPKIVNFDKSSCYPFLSSSDSEEKTSNQYSKNSFSSNINIIQTQSYQDDLLSEISLRMNKFAEKEKSSSTESLKNIMEDKAIGDAIGDLLNKEKLKFLISFKTVQIDILFEKWGLFQTYRAWLWFFTSAGWKYAQKMFLATYPEIPINISDQLVSILDNIRQNWNQNLNILWALSHQFWTLIKWKFREKILPKLNPLLSHPLVSYLLKLINKTVVEGKDTSISFDTWKYILNVREYDIFLCIFIGFFFFISCIIPFYSIQFFRNWKFVQELERYPYIFREVGKTMESLRMLRNFSNLNLYGSWLAFLDFTEMESDPDDIGLLLLLKIWYVKNIQWLLRPYSRRYHSMIKTLLYEFEVDDFLLRENRLFSVQEKISQFESKLTPPIGFFSEYFEKRKEPGLLYFRFLAEFIQLGLTHRIGIMNYELKSLLPAEISIFAAFQQRITSMPIHSSLLDQVRFFPFYPMPSFSNRILLIGPRETGRSYLAKSLAADSYLPLIRISPNSFMRQQKLLSRYEPEYTSSAQNSYLEHENILMSMGWSGRPKDLLEKDHYDKKPHKFLHDREDPNPPEYFSKRVFQFMLALRLAKLMSPCVIWIPSIHEINDYYFLVTLLTELLGDSYHPGDGEQETTIKQNIIVIASTHIPKKIDPFLITPPRNKRRFDTFINTKRWPAPHREKEFPVLLRNKGLYLKKEWNCYDEFGLNTKGFTTRDLANLANYILLISINQNISAIDNDIIGVALYRSSWGPCNYNLKFSAISKVLPYKIGKAIIQNKLTYLKNFLRLTLDFQGRRANYLHQWYLEPSVAGTAAKEFTIFYHILGCLAGSVAQDCWFLSESNKENWTPFDPFIANDFILASSLLQGLLEEFPWLAIYRGNSDYITIAPQFKRDTMQKGLSSMLDEIVLSKELRYAYEGYRGELGTPVVCDSRTWRFSFFCGNRFEHIKDITIENPLLDYLHLFGGFQERPTRLSSLYWKKFLASGTYLLSLYAGKDDIVERKTAAFWEAKFLYNKFQRLGIYQFDTEEYAMEYKPLNTPVIYLSRRFLWDPVSIRFVNKHPAFERKELFVSKELVKSIYLTYSSTRELKISIRKSLKSIIRRKKVKKIALGMKIQTDDNDLPQIKRREDFETFKRYQEIGIRLRRVLPYSQSVISERWFREKTRDDKFKQFLLKGERENIDLLSNECFIYKTLFESYEYLSNLFFSNRILFKQMINTLFKTKWLSPNAIDCLLAEGLNKNKKD
uniref:Protein Ycf2 n=1 Tax=Cunninghamia lanceolata TaxID=28977 RepID=R4L5F1_CUNLA|nr:hypothetical chloroplast RF2 [Cunninghamia lanceolata]AGL10970.1 hypothetical chloroplast RF2 [Cunninghamia lanceolata]